MWPGPASRSISSRHLIAICRVSSKFDPGRRPEPQYELARVDLREQLPADLHSQQPQDQGARPDIAQDHPPPQADEPAHRLAISLEHPVEKAALLLAMPPVPEQCHAQDRHERAGEHVRRDHREPDRQGQRHEQRPQRVGHDERRDEHGQDAQKRQQDRHRRRIVAAQGGRGDPRRAPHLHVHVLDRHRRHVDQDADRQRHAAQRHDVDRVARRPQPDQ